MSAATRYEDQIKEIVKQATGDGVTFTAKGIAAIVSEAYAEMSAETARNLYGQPR